MSRRQGHHQGPSRDFMVFNSLTFLCFFAVVLGLHALPLSWRAKKTNLLVASYLFYAAWNPPFIILLWISTALDWFAARAIARAPTLRRRRAWLAISLVGNLGMLGYFKYGGFLLENAIALAAILGISYQPAAPDIFLPIGISFYTFQTLSYTIDVYRGTLAPARSFLDFALYVTFFPQLVAGPIVRASQFLPQCATPRSASAATIGWGLSLLVLGLFEKVVVADAYLAPIANSVFASLGNSSCVDAWVGTLAFSGQIFFDFAGYSTCAIGAAACLGFFIPDNFRFPYAAIGFSDFWRRWHISLSQWLRDYLYISLGGNRSGAVRTSVNLLVTMLLGGLWHGASWRFVIWGGLHGLYLTIERAARHLFRDSRWVNRLFVRVLISLITYLAVVVAWVFFRAESVEAALLMLSAMAGNSAAASVCDASEILIAGAATIGLWSTHWLMRERTLGGVVAGLSWWSRSLALAFMILALCTIRGESQAFIYFQF